MEIFYLYFYAYHLLKALSVSAIRKDLVMTWWMQCCTELLLFIGVTDNMGTTVQVIFVTSLVLSCTISLALDDAGASDFLMCNCMSSAGITWPTLLFYSE